jgi:hypothetical protein
MIDVATAATDEVVDSSGQPHVLLFSAMLVATAAAELITEVEAALLVSAYDEAVYVSE